MRVRIYNAKILTMENEELIEGEIWVDNGIIIYVGAEGCVEKSYFDREIDACKNLVMPGFKNAHAHSAMTFARSYADGFPLNKWLTEKIFPMEAKLKKEHIASFTELAYLEYISSGITANFDMYYEPDAIAEVTRTSGMRTVLCGAVNNFRDSISILDSNYQIYNSKEDLVSYILGFHAEYTTDIHIIEEIARLANKYRAPVFAHNSETEQEVKGCFERYQLSPTQLFEKCGIYEYGGGGFHCIYLDDEDIEIFKNKNLFVVTNSCSNMKLASGICPVYDYLEKGVNVALGTDGASSNNAMDMFREMYITSMLQKVVKKDPGAIKPFDILKMATVTGAKAMALNDCTALSQGKKADLIIIDLDMPNMQPQNNIISDLVYSCGKQNILLTMINGEILYENGEFSSIDKERVFFETKMMVKDLQ